MSLAEGDIERHAARLERPPYGAPDIEAAFPESASFGLMSAWDPYSTPRPEAVNRAADEALHTALLASGLPFRPGFSSAPNRSWREPSWVVMDMPEDEFDRLA